MGMEEAQKKDIPTSLPFTGNISKAISPRTLKLGRDAELSSWIDV